MLDVNAYREDGYLLMKGFFQREQIEAIRNEAKQVFIAQMRRHGIVETDELSEAEFEAGMFRLFETDIATLTNCGKQVQHLISLHRLSLSEPVVEAVKSLGLAFPNVSTRPLLYFNSRRLAKKEVYWRLSVHQDWRSMQGSLDAIVLWVPLIDIDRDLGALEVIPGSHKMGLLDSEMSDGYGHISASTNLPEPVPVEVEAGDALFFSAFLVHQSGTSTTDSIRWSCHFRYNNLDEATFVERGFPHPYIYRPQVELITSHFPERGQVENVFRPSGSQ
jgi:ectoine hydroxylase-related dioxygenase (phytanoyl-CoA dioxygenase family)